MDGGLEPVRPRYDYYPGAGVPFASQHEYMAQRRRIAMADLGEDGSTSEDSNSATAVSWAAQQRSPGVSQQAQQRQLSYPNAAASTSTSAGARRPSVSAAAVGGSGAAAGPAGQQWTRTHGHGSSYSDLLSYQLPYFSQQTDPSVYRSPWPPAAAGSYGNTATSAGYNLPSSSAVSQSATMPFFASPRQTRTQTTEAFNSSTGFQNGHEFEQVAPQYASTAAQTRNGGPKPPAALYLEDASMHLKIQSLTILDNLAAQLIQTIAKANFAQIQDLMHGTDSEDGQAYVTLKNLFDQTRKVYSRDSPFIDAIAIQMFQPSQQEVIRKANIATFISSILGAHDVSFFHLNEFFMETFVPLGHRLLKWQGAIYLELKTQTYISALINSDGTPEVMLDELFPSDLDAQILTRHPDAPSLSPSEQDFIDRSRSRKSYLLAEPSSEETVRELPKKYQWNDFVREFASCINKNVDSIITQSVRTFGPATGPKGATDGDLGHDNPPGKDGKPQGKPLPLGSTIRQPWTKPEEDALLSGLDKVNGPHWSQILALYGRGGSVSEVLKDRNQVQLKDKARNLKLWYLKMGKEVPVALRSVTGELRKRGGARARAALGLADDGSAMVVDEEGGAEVESGENADPSLNSSARKSTKKRKAVKKS